MREQMAALINSQLDFIFFFYGLAFILLGTTCFAIAREGGRGEPWAVLGLFGFIHGAGEWLDLSALVIGDSPTYAVLRTAVATISFLVLLEFARLEAQRFGLQAVRHLRWLYVPLIVLVLVAGIWHGVNTANAVARYAIGFVAALATSLVFARYAHTFSGAAKRLTFATAAEFALYAVAAGLIVPSAPFWPANTFDYGWFVHLTGVPIQLLRGLLACAIALSLWAIWGHLLILKVATPHYTAYLRRQFTMTLTAMGVILVCGWILTEFLGGIYKQNAQVEAQSDIDLLASSLSGKTALVEGMVRA